MRSIIRNFRLTWIFTSTFWQTVSQYRIGAITWVINAAVTPLLMMSVWLVVSSKNQLAMSQSQIVTYFLLTIVVDRLTGSWSLYKIGNQIRSGNFSNTLLKPFSYLVEVISHTLSMKFIRLATLVPIFIGISLLFRTKLSLNLTGVNVFLFILAILIGFCIRFYWNILLGLFTFWLEEFHSIENLDGLFGQVLSGGLIPIALAPPLVGYLITYSFYRFFISFPIELILGQTSSNKILEGFVLGILYLFMLATLIRLIYKLGLKKYGAYGS